MKRTLFLVLPAQLNVFLKTSTSRKKIHLAWKFGVRSLFFLGFLLPNSGTLFLPTGVLF
jgi:hypothetical protein